MGLDINVPDEMPQWEAYMLDQVVKHRLTPKTFEARRGDVFIWNSYLLHGGCPIEAPGKTRQSIVSHYYSEEDARALGMRLVPEHGGYWIHRGYQAVEGFGTPPAPELPISAAVSTKMHSLAYRVRRKLAV
jgi:hypothetical protein